MGENKKIDWKKVGWRTLQVLLIIIINGATVAWFVMNCIDLGQLNGTSVSYWDAISSKPLFELMKQTSDNAWIKQWANAHPYHFWYKFLVYIFMLVGYILTFLFIKLLYNNHRENKNQEREDIRSENFINAMKSMTKSEKQVDKEVDKIMKGVK